MSGGKGKRGSSISLGGCSQEKREKGARSESSSFFLGGEKREGRKVGVEHTFLFSLGIGGGRRNQQEGEKRGNSAKTVTPFLEPQKRRGERGRKALPF